VLLARNFDRGTERFLRLGGIRCALGQQQFAFQPVHFRLIVPLAGSLDDRE
jgi:hypothetical protein